MAHFDADELVDCIRHNMRMMDESNLTARILKPPRRRMPPGSLPLEMCRKKEGKSSKDEEEEDGEEDDEDGPGCPRTMLYQLPREGTSNQGQQPALPIREEIRKRLLAKLREMEQSGRLNKGDQPVAQRPTKCTIKFEPRIVPDARQKMGGKNEENNEHEHDNDGMPSTSLAARLLSEPIVEDDLEAFAEFARFESMEGSSGPSKRFNILFPFAKKPRCVIQIQIIRTATIADLIGLACHIYTRQKHEPPCDPPMEYDLYLAEEDMEDFDMELPPQDRRRRVAECGFPNLAMVKRSIMANRRPSQRIQNHQINIFLVDGRCYTMETESLDILLRQVLEYGLERKRDDDRLHGQSANDEANSAFFRRIDYILEPLDQPSVALDLKASVSSIGTNDFVLLRRNSARGDCLMAALGRNGMANHQFGMLAPPPAGMRNIHNSRSLEFNQLSLDIPPRPYGPIGGGGSKPNTPTGGGGTENADWTKRQTRFSLRHSKSHHQQFPQQPHSPYSIDSMATFGRRSGAELAQMMLEQSLPDAGTLLAEFQVNRIHRFQPKTPSSLVVRERCLELIPIHSQSDSLPTAHGGGERDGMIGGGMEQMKKRASSMGKSAQAKKIPWELVAAVEVPPNSEQRQNARRIVRIIFLNGVQPGLLQHIIESGKNGRPPPEVGNSMAYEGTYWKTLLIDAAAEEAWQIGVRLSELLDSRPSQVHMLYQYSSGASLKPQSAADKAFGTSKSLFQKHSPMGDSSESTIGGGAEKAPKKKLSMIFSRMRL